MEKFKESYMPKYLIAVSLFLIMVMSTACTQGTESKSAGVVVIDLNELIELSPHLKALIKKRRDKTEDRKIKALIMEEEKLNKKYLAATALITDPNSRELKDLRDKYRYDLEKIQEQIYDISMQRAREEMQVYDKTYRDISKAALTVAAAHGAVVVLPINELPSPNPDVKFQKGRIVKNPGAEAGFLLQQYKNDLVERKVVTYHTNADVTPKVYAELKKNHQWK
jgi:hypothetical protein